MFLKSSVAAATLALALICSAACTNDVDASSEPEEATSEESPEAPSELELTFDTAEDENVNESNCSARGSVIVPKLDAALQIVNYEANAHAGTGEPTDEGDSRRTEYKLVISLDQQVSINLMIRSHMGAWIVKVSVFNLSKGQTEYETDLADDTSEWNIAVDGTAASIPSAKLYNMSAKRGSSTLNIENLEFVCISL